MTHMGWHAVKPINQINLLPTINISDLSLKSDLKVEMWFRILQLMQETCVSYGCFNTDKIF